MALAFLTGPGPWALFLCFSALMLWLRMPRGVSSVLSDPVPLRFCFFAFLFCFFFYFALISGYSSVLEWPGWFVFLFLFLPFFFFVLCVDQDTPSVFIARRSHLMFLLYWSLIHEGMWQICNSLKLISRSIWFDLVESIDIEPWAFPLLVDYACPLFYFLSL